MVGALIVYEGKIVAQGYHRACGMAHAEVEAIGRVGDADILRKSTLYVNLEPCCHHGRTPPCSELIIRSGIRRVVTAMQDPCKKVNGGGIAALRQHGIEVVEGILHSQAMFLNRRFITFHSKKRPYIILKWAQSSDGYIDRLRSVDAAPERISGMAAQRLSHLWRTQEDAIMIGTNTAVMDNPMLTARLCYGRNPQRIVVDADDKLPRTLRIFGGDAPALKLHTRSASGMASALYDYGIQSVIIEGGAKLLQSFIDSMLWDEARIITSPKRMGSGAAAPCIDGNLMERQPIGDDVCTIIIAKG
jgi:diaminohydroxyphosphoribosylaminopyrimidine deaminase/5-amino-6-(5-phosphoribosylamino)uracil reductase